VNWDRTIPHTGITLLQLLTAAIVLVAGMIVSRVIVAVFRRQLRRTNLSDILVEFLARFLTILLFVVVILLVLTTLGVTIGSLLLSLSAIVGLILGFGMQDTVNNIASGTWIAALRPIDIGEVVTINGMTGKVNAVGILATELLTPDNTFITIPNGEVWGSPIVNYTRMPTRRVDVSVGIGYAESVDRAVQVAIDLMKSHDLVTGDPEPAGVVTELGDSSVNLQLRAWAQTADYWAVKGDLTKGILEALTAEGIEIPFPQLDVHTKGN
jgi:small-conductance mechanosensitive channel